MRVRVIVQDNSHVSLLVRSPIFQIVSSTSSAYLTFKFTGGKGNQNNIANYSTSAAFISANSGNSMATGVKGLAIRRVSDDNWIEIIYKTCDACGAEVFTISASKLTAWGLATGVNYTFDFFDNDQGSWGWTLLDYVCLTVVSASPTRFVSHTAAHMCLLSFAPNSPHLQSTHARTHVLTLTKTLRFC